MLKIEVLGNFRFIFIMKNLDWKNNAINVNLIHKSRLNNRLFQFDSNKLILDKL